MSVVTSSNNRSRPIFVLACICIAVSMIVLVVATLIFSMRYRFFARRYEITEDIFQDAVRFAVSNYLDNFVSNFTEFGTSDLPSEASDDKKQNSSFDDFFKCENVDYSFWLDVRRRGHCILEGVELSLGSLSSRGQLIFLTDSSLLFRRFDGGVILVSNLRRELTNDPDPLEKPNNPVAEAGTL